MHFQDRNREEIALRLDSIIETAVDGIITIDERGVIEIANPASAQLFGYRPEEMVGQHISMLMPEPHRSRHDQYMADYKHTGIAKIIGIGRELQGRRKNGDLFPFRLSISEVDLEGGKVFTGILHDLTDQKRAEEQIRKFNATLEAMVAQRTEELASIVNQLLASTRKLEKEIHERQMAEQALRQIQLELEKALAKEKELNELKSRFVSMASHEFRTPLSTILSSAALLGRYIETDQQDKRERHIAKIKSSVENLTGILNDFLSLSKLEEGKVNAQLAPLPVNAFCRTVLEDMEGLLKPGQTTTFRPLTEEHILNLDERLLRNSLINLLSNAVKYSDEGTDITLSLDLAKEGLDLSVADQGMGIPEGEQAYLFTRFFRATNALHVKGTGLGLVIVKRYMDLMGGNISFQSEQGKGSTFTLGIPYAKLR